MATSRERCVARSPPPLRMGPRRRVEGVNYAFTVATGANVSWRSKRTLTACSSFSLSPVCAYISVARGLIAASGRRRTPTEKNLEVRGLKPSSAIVDVSRSSKDILRQARRHWRCCQGTPRTPRNPARVVPGVGLFMGAPAAQRRLRRLCLVAGCPQHPGRFVYFPRGRVRDTRTPPAHDRMVGVLAARPREKARRLKESTPLRAAPLAGMLFCYKNRSFTLRCAGGSPPTTGAWRSAHRRSKPWAFTSPPKSCCGGGRAHKELTASA